MRQAKDMWDFPVVEGVIFHDANRVHPLMQRRVDKLLHALVKDQNIRRPSGHQCERNFGVAVPVILIYMWRNSMLKKNWNIYPIWIVK